MYLHKTYLPFQKRHILPTQILNFQLMTVAKCQTNDIFISLVSGYFEKTRTNFEAGPCTERSMNKKWQLKGALWDKEAESAKNQTDTSLSPTPSHPQPRPGLFTGPDIHKHPPSDLAIRPPPHPIHLPLFCEDTLSRNQTQALAVKRDARPELKVLGISNSNI